MSATFTSVRNGQIVLLKTCRTCGEAKVVSETPAESGFTLNCGPRGNHAATFKADCKACYRDDPALNAKRCAAVKAWREKKKKAEPAYFAESARLAYHLRREKAGRPVGVRPFKSDALMPADVQARLPTPPLVELIDRLAAGGYESTVCVQLGISQRRLFAWRSGESRTAGFDAVEKVLRAAQVDVADVWPADRFPEVARRFGYLEDAA